MYRAKDLRLGREAAVKVVPEAVAYSPERLARFEREPRTVAGLNHPNIVVLYSVEDEDGIRFLTMELVEGRNMATLVTQWRASPLPRSRTVDSPGRCVGRRAQALRRPQGSQTRQRDGDARGGGSLRKRRFGLALQQRNTPGKSFAVRIQVRPSRSGSNVALTLPALSPILPRHCPGRARRRSREGLAMRRNYPRLASCGVLAALLIPLLPAQVVSQPGGCPSRVASSDGVNPKYSSCAVLLQGSYKDTWDSDSQFEVIGEPPSPCSALEWIWVFDDVPAGSRYLTFKGQSQCRNYQFLVRFCDTANSCPYSQQPCPWDRYLPIDSAVITTTATKDITVPIASDSVSGRVCLILRTMQSSPPCGRETDEVSVDFLEITTDPTSPCNPIIR